MKPTKVEFTERFTTPTDNIIRQCRNLIHDKTGKDDSKSFTHSKKACLTCKYKFRCYTI